MMKLTEKTELYAKGNKHFTGRYKNHSVDIQYIECNPLVAENIIPFWFFCCTNTKTDNSYNSLCDKLKFKTQQECVDAVIKYINENINKIKE